MKGNALTLSLNTRSVATGRFLYGGEGEKMKKLINSLGKDGLKSAYSLLEHFALYLTIAVAVILLVAYVIVKFRAKDKLDNFKKFTFGAVVGYAVTLSLCISFLMVARLYVKSELDKNFYLMLGFFAVCLAYVITAAILSVSKKKAFKICNIVGVSLIAIYALVLLLVLPTIDKAYEPLSVAGMYIFSLLLVAGMVVCCIVFDKKTSQTNQTKSIAYAGVAIALSFALSYVKLFSLPQGGSVTLASMLPLIIYSSVFGVRKGVLAGIVYGVLQCLQSPQIYQPMQVLVDYPIAFGVIGLAGITKNLKCVKSLMGKFIIGAVIACVCRYVAHFISGYYVFSSWAMEGYTALTWSLVYNLFIIVELLIIVFVGCVIYSSKAVRQEIQKLY